MGYHSALEKAGAEVHVFENFGSYQGEWWAKVTYGDEIGWANGAFGSCSGCDSFEAEFGWEDPTDEQLATFGKQYLSDLYTQDEAEVLASKHISWDMEAHEMLKFIQNNR